MSEAPDISVVIPVFDKAEALPHVVAAFARQSPMPEAEYIFVDDASRDGSVAVLKGLAARLANLRVIENTVNAGPAVRVNQGAEAARGRLLCLLDADEIVAPDALAVMARLIADRGADMVHGKVARGQGRLADARTPPIGAAPDIAVSDAPLRAVATGRGFVRMAWMVTADLFRTAGGCDRRIFIQDESLPLRLARHARRFVDLRAAVTAAAADGGHLSRDRAQQHHDRFFAAYNLLCDCEQHGVRLPEDVARALARKCFSAAWKATGAGLDGHRARLFLDYLMSRGPFVGDRRHELSRIAGLFRAVPGIRRPEAS